ncbi:uncharacterized protein LOC132265539 [Phlebotomus argentipes]|uniref:uncharacterized protein LOC132265539 n=1 Tax=Phlebotomus argentipes TaxID=94469 RepID=UPI00289354B3|nr:uncharacterized protein LOC132265539 [Phlebotomus argentipes]
MVNPEEYSNVAPEDVTESEEMIIQRAREAFLRYQEMYGGAFDDDEEDDDEEESASGSGVGAPVDEEEPEAPQRKLPENNAIKFLQTPHGKVGILYQTDNRRESTDELQEDANRQEKPAGRITPVLTPDGKVALLYRGASETIKYEPLLNVTSKFAQPDNKWMPEEATQSNSVVDSATEVTTEATEASEEDNDEENFILPSINRPLSEVLGIKKNQFTQFRITEATTPMPRSAVTFRKAVLTTKATYDYDYEAAEDDTTVGASNEIDPEILSKTEVVNLAIIPSFSNDIEQYARHDREKHYRSFRRNRAEELSGIHCAMQAMVAAAALACFFGMLGAYFKTRILDQITIMHW